MSEKENPRNEIRYSPKPKNRRAQILWISLFLLSSAVILFSFFMPAYGGAVQLAGIIFMVIALFVAYKYSFSSYTYVIMPTEGEGPSFLIEGWQGRRMTLLCHLPLRQIRSVTGLAGDEKRLREKPFSYIATMRGGSYQLIRAVGERGEVLIRIEADEAFLSALRMLLSSVHKAQTEAERLDDRE